MQRVEHGYKELMKLSSVNYKQGEFLLIEGLVQWVPSDSKMAKLRKNT